MLKRRHLGGNHKQNHPIWAILCCSGLRYATDSTFLKVVITIFSHLSFQPQKKVCVPGLCSKKAVPFTPANQKNTSNPPKKTHKLPRSPSPFSKRPSPRKTTRKKIWKKSAPVKEVHRHWDFSVLSNNLELGSTTSGCEKFLQLQGDDVRKKFTKNNICCSKVLLYTRNSLPKNHQKIPCHFLEKRCNLIRLLLYDTG